VKIHTKRGSFESLFWFDFTLETKYFREDHL